MEFVLMVIGLVQAHWQTVAIVGGAVAGLTAAVKNRAYAEFFKLALILVREVAVQELSGPEKRKWVVEEGYKRLPLWAKKAVTQQQLEVWAERAYALLRGELTAAKTAEEYVADNTFDPTKGILDGEELRITSPLKIEE